VVNSSSKAGNFSQKAKENTEFLISFSTFLWK